MIEEIIEKVTFLLDNNPLSITLVLSIILGSPFAIPHALTIPNTTPTPPSLLGITAVALLGSLSRMLIIITITLSLCNLISKSPYIQRSKIRFNSFFYTKFGLSTYRIYNHNHSSVIVLFLSCIPYLNPLISSTIGHIIGLGASNNIYLNMIGLTVSNMLITLWAIGNMSRFISLMLITFAIIISLILIILPYLRISKKVK